MTGPACALCGSVIAGKRVRGMHPGCYRKALACGAVVALRPARKAPVPDPLDAAVEAIVRRKAAT